MKTAAALNVESISIEDDCVIYIVKDEDTAKRMLKKNAMAQVVADNGKFALIYSTQFFSPLGSLKSR